ncbi:MAG: penicillin-binding protein 2 [Alphaproteobacteria bacterium]
MVALPFANWLERRIAAGSAAAETVERASGENALEQGRGRLTVLAACCLVAFSAVVWRLVALSLSAPPEPRTAVLAAPGAERADIFDRNGELLARDIELLDVIAKPRYLPDRAGAARALAKALPDQISAADLAKRFKNDDFAYVLRNATPKEFEALHALGLPGVSSRVKPQRAYPKGSLLAHVLGHVNVDNEGLAGIELARDAALRARGHAGEPMRLSVDTQIQFAVRDVLADGVREFGAVSATGIVLDVDNGEILSLVSLPDFDPAAAGRAGNEGKRNRATGTVYEMGSVFKPFTFAAAFETGALSMRDYFDARVPLKIGRRTIHDFHPENRWLSAEEVFIHSSNIGTAQIALRMGVEPQKKYLGELGLLARSPVELPEVEKPLVQGKWGPVESVTISYGYGIMVTPLQVASAIGALVNGGAYVAPTILKRTADAAVERRQIFSSATGRKILSLMRANVLDGTGRGADVAGYDVGGKTGTANKQEGGSYQSGKRLSSFVAVFPVKAPRYLVLMCCWIEPTRAMPGGQYLVPDRQRHRGATIGPHHSPNCADTGYAAGKAGIIRAAKRGPRAKERPAKALTAGGRRCC